MTPSDPESIVEQAGDPSSGDTAVAAVRGAVLVLVDAGAQVAAIRHAVGVGVESIIETETDVTIIGHAIAVAIDERPEGQPLGEVIQGADARQTTAGGDAGQVPVALSEQQQVTAQVGQGGGSGARCVGGAGRD